MKDYLKHYGIKGQKWGVRRYRNEDGTLTADGRERYKRRKYDKLFYTEKYRKGDKFYRITNTPGEKFKDRMYVSRSKLAYIDDYFIDDYDKTHMEVYEARKDFVSIGRKEVNDILQAIGQKRFVSTASGNNKNDFMLKDSDLRKAFLKEAKKRGTDSMIDPVDRSLNPGWDSASIILNDKVLKRIGSYTVSDFLSNHYHDDESKTAWQSKLSPEKRKELEEAKKRQAKSIAANSHKTK